VVALLVLVLLTLMGISATTTSTIEVQMAGSEKFHEMAFYAADSGWQEALNWLDRQYPAVTWKYMNWDGENFIKFDGDFTDFTKDAGALSIPLAGDNHTEYYLKIESVGTTPVAGYGSDYRRFNYRVNSEGKVNQGGTASSIARSEVSVIVGKVFDMGVY
jgi:Tfp pilus assembly protein PilX